MELSNNEPTEQQMQGMTAGLYRAQDRDAHRAQLTSQAHHALRAEVMKAFAEGSQVEIRTPGFSRATTTAGQLLLDDIGAGDGSEARLDQLVGLLRDLAAGHVDASLMLRANLLLAGIANRHAEFHRDDLVEQMEVA